MISTRVVKVEILKKISHLKPMKKKFLVVNPDKIGAKVERRLTEIKRSFFEKYLFRRDAARERRLCSALQRFEKLKCRNLIN